MYESEEEENEGEDNDKSKDKKNDDIEKVSAGMLTGSINCQYCGSRYIFRYKENDKNPQVVCPYCGNKAKGLTVVL